MLDVALVLPEPVGRASLFRLAQPALADVLAAAEVVLGATGNAVASCPTNGLDACIDSVVTDFDQRPPAISRSRGIGATVGVWHRETAGTWALPNWSLSCRSVPTSVWVNRWSTWCGPVS